MEMKRFNTLAAIAFCLYLTAIGSLCFMRGDSLPSVTGTWFGIPADKIVHLLMFLPFIPLAFFTFSRERNSFGRNIVLMAALMSVGVITAYTTELIQEKLSYRSYDLKDMAADCIGLAAGFAITFFRLIIKHISNRH